jgi:hypothetical protein
MVKDVRDLSIDNFQAWELVNEIIAWVVRTSTGWEKGDLEAVDKVHPILGGYRWDNEGLL